MIEIKTEEQQNAADAKSVFVKNVDYKTDPTELKEHFASCGTISRITIVKDQMTGHPLGYNKLSILS